ncbi:ABC transporter substrate-binding protein [Microbacterium ulmi]|nr:ABC transporter substrate-binding protein [Microbacterium ulmi]
MVVLGVAAASLVLTACGGGGGGGGNTVSVLGVWSGAEQDSFLAMVAPWEEETGYTVQYTGSRDINAQITAGIASGNLPDVAGIPGPGQVKEWYDSGALQPLDFLDIDAYEASTPPGFAELGTTADDTLAGVFTKAAVKGLVFYNTGVWDGSEPATYDELNATADSLKTGDETTWCVGLESGAASGWPGTDWIESFVLRQSGPDVYDQWASGELEWTSPEIREAFEAFGEVLDNSFGGSDFIVNTNFGRAGNPLFSDPPGCLLHQQATFITDFFQNEAGATPDQYAFYRFPDVNTQFTGGVTGGGDIIGMFNDTEAARSLIEYLITPEAQQIWVERGGFLAANLDVPLDAYPDDINRKSAEILQSVEVFRFDASDTMPAAVSDAFNRAMVQFAQNQGNLDSILQSIEAARQDAAN